MEHPEPTYHSLQTEGISRRQFVRSAIASGISLPFLFAYQESEAEIQLSVPSPAEQKRLGAQSAAQILGKYKEIKDGRATYFTEMGTRLVKALPAHYRDPWNFEFHVLESKEINAFSIPGGPMFIFTGLYQVMHTEDSLAAVTGHELAHVYSQHWAKAYARENRREVAVDIAAILSGHFLRGEVLGNIAAGLMKQRYSRSEEDQADARGLTNVADAGFNPNGMLQMFEDLQKVAGNGNDALGGVFLSDHPLTSTRIAHTKRRIAAYGSRRFPAMTPLNYASLAS
jgi:predicted Zn-dependent protease